MIQNILSHFGIFDQLFFVFWFYHIIFLPKAGLSLLIFYSTLFKLSTIVMAESFRFIK